jgi:hypothetical protein
LKAHLKSHLLADYSTPGIHQSLALLNHKTLERRGRWRQLFAAQVHHKAMLGQGSLLKFIRNVLPALMQQALTAIKFDKTTFIPKVSDTMTDSRTTAKFASIVRAFSATAANTLPGLLRRWSR